MIIFLRHKSFCTWRKGGRKEERKNESCLKITMVWPPVLRILEISYARLSPEDLEQFWTSQSEIAETDR